MFEGFWSVTRSHISRPFYERNWSETTCIIYWFRKMKRSKYTWRYNINFIELSLFGFFREINSDTNSNTWIFAYKFHKNVRENVKTGIFFFKFSSLYLVCGTCIDHALIQKIYLDIYKSIITHEVSNKRLSNVSLAFCNLNMCPRPFHCQTEVF